MYCKDCPRYDDDGRFCRDGKVNPQRWSEAIDVANLYGVRSICTYNDHREKLVRSRAPQTGSSAAMRRRDS